MKTELNLKAWLESEAYQKQKEVLNRDINELKQRMSPMGNPYALDRHAAPAQLFVTDYSVFKKSEEEKWKVHNLKKEIGKSKNHKFTTITHVSL